MVSLADDVPGIADAEEIGAGGYGRVYKARQPAFDRTVAVKILHGRLDDADILRRFQRECQAIGAVAGHPNIVGVHDAGGTPSGHPYIVMPYLRRGSLADQLRRKPVAWRQAVQIGVKIAGALHSAHSAGILHRDIKPENILVSDYGEPQLADFGIAQRAGSSHSTMTAAAMTPAQGAPELLSDGRPSVASDVYGLASTVHTLITGEPPFVRRGEESVFPMLARIATEPPPDLRRVGVPDAVARVIEHGMAKSPQERPVTALQFGQELQQAEAALGLPVTVLPLADEDDVVGPPPGPPVQAQPAYPRSPQYPTPPSQYPTPPQQYPTPPQQPQYQTPPQRYPTPPQPYATPPAPAAQQQPAYADPGYAQPPAAGPAPARRRRGRAVVLTVVALLVAGAGTVATLRATDRGPTYALITPGLLGAGSWQQIGTPAVADLAFCNTPLAIGAGGRQAVTLLRAEPVSVASQQVARRPSGGARELLAAVRRSATGCTAWSATEDGGLVSYRLQPVTTAPTVGDDSAVYQVTRTAGGRSVTAVEVYLVRGDVLSVLSWAGRALPTAADIAFVERLAGTAAAQLPGGTG